jgi:hypothetical protein
VPDLKEFHAIQGAVIQQLVTEINVEIAHIENLRLDMKRVAGRRAIKVAELVDLMGVAKAAELIGCSRQTVYNALYRKAADA